MGILKGFFKCDVEEEAPLTFTPPAPKPARPYVPFKDCLWRMSSDELTTLLHHHAAHLHHDGDDGSARLIRAAARHIRGLIDERKAEADAAVLIDVRRFGT